MKAVALDLLIETQDKGIALRPVGAELEYEGPEESVSEELVANLRLHKRELLNLLRWDEEVAYQLIRDALAHLNEFYVEGSDLTVLDAWEDRIDDAYDREDMGALRIALKGYVSVGRSAFGRKEYA
jgi:hypothetical protein